MDYHHLKQIEIINQIEDQVNNNTIQFTTISPVEDYENDSRMCLTSVHFPRKQFIDEITDLIISPLRTVDPSLYYYSPESLHMTIKNVKVINDPPTFSKDDIAKAVEVFDTVIPQHRKFKIYFYRLLLFPNNLALIGTTDIERDNLFFDLDDSLRSAGIPDDKIYTNSKYFFMNITLARFNTVDEHIRTKINVLTQQLSLNPYTVDTVSLVSCNAVLKKLTVHNAWQLKS